MKKLAKILLDVILIAVIILTFIAIYNFFQIQVFNKTYSNFFGYSIFEVTTGSMSKTIEMDDAILVKITKDVHKGDIITFEEDNSVVTHRIIEEQEGYFLTKGDANNGTDKPVLKENVIGKVVKILPKFGIWMKVMTDKTVIIFVMITIFLFGLSISSKENAETTNVKMSFSKRMRKRREKRNGKSKEKEKS